MPRLENTTGNWMMKCPILTKSLSRSREKNFISLTGTVQKCPNLSITKRLEVDSFPGSLRTLRREIWVTQDTSYLLSLDTSNLFEFRFSPSNKVKESRKITIFVPVYIYVTCMWNVLTCLYGNQMPGFFSQQIQAVHSKTTLFNYWKMCLSWPQHMFPGARGQLSCPLFSIELWPQRRYDPQRKTWHINKLGYHMECRQDTVPAGHLWKPQSPWFLGAS